MSVQLLRRRFTVDEYHQMAQAGILHEDDRVELIEGEIVEMAAIGSRHAACVDRLNRLFTSRLGESVIVRVQNPVRLNIYNEPQPDLALLRARDDFYAGGHPGPHDTLLAVEVSDTTLAYDLTIKVPLYARTGIPETWVIDLEQEVVRIFHGAGESGGYREKPRVPRGGVVDALTVPGARFEVDKMLPPGPTEPRRA